MIGVIHRERLHTLDVVRGVMLLLVMWYHLCFDLAVFYAVPMPWFFGWQGESARIFMTGSLMIISGISCTLSKSNAKRGAKTLAVALLLTAVTMFALPQSPIWFGILHYFGCMMLFYPLLQRGLARLPVWSGLLFLAGFALLFRIPSGYILNYQLPVYLYQSNLTFWLGFPHPTFSSVDYYPLLPWSMLFFAGVALGQHFLKNGYPRWMYALNCAPLEFVGRHTLFFYLMHQPVFLAVLYLLWG